MHSEIQGKLKNYPDPMSCPGSCNYEDTMVPFLGTTIAGISNSNYGEFTIENLGGDGSTVVNADGQATHEYSSFDEDDLTFIYAGTSSLCSTTQIVQFIIQETLDETLVGTELVSPGSVDQCYWSIFNYCFCPPTTAPTTSAMPSISSSPSVSVAASESPSAAPTNTIATDEDDGEGEGEGEGECCCCEEDEKSLLVTIRSVFGF